MSRRGGHTASSFRGRGGGVSSVGANSSHQATRPATNASISNGNSNTQRLASSGGGGGGAQSNQYNRDGTVNFSSALNIGAAPRIQLPSDPSRRIIDYSSSDDKCPQCKTDRYLNPKLKLLVSPCYHKLCESCLDRIFSLGPAPCPECGVTCRKNQFGIQTFQDLQVEREVDVRRRVGRWFNKREEDFENLSRYNDYLEEVESITFNLINGVDKEETELRISNYLNSNKASIQNNVRSQEVETEVQREKELADKAFRSERAQRRRERQDRDRLEKEADERQVVEALAGRTGVDVQSVMKQQEENEKRREARREKEERQDELEEAQRGIIASGTGKSKVGSKGEDSRPAYHVEMLWDFEGPLATLDDSRFLFNLRSAPASLGGSVSNGASISYDDPWITAELPREEVTRLRAGGYNWSLAWQREIQIAVEGLGIAPAIN
jgi:CDK-activating kinase assembly factor MAT1